MSGDAWTELRKLHPWPAARPPSHGTTQWGWLHDKTKAMLRTKIEPGSTVVEIGSWLGLSARFIMEQCQATRIVCIDHWEGSPEIEHEHGHLFGQPIYEAFLHHSWDLRERITALRLHSWKGVALCGSLGLEPDAVYIDGAHDAKSVAEDVTNCGATWPNAVLIGDDWNGYGVAEGVQRALGDKIWVGKPWKIEDNGKAWCARKA